MMSNCTDPGGWSSNSDQKEESAELELYHPVADFEFGLSEVEYENILI